MPTWDAGITDGNSMHYFAMQAVVLIFECRAPTSVGSWEGQLAGHLYFQVNCQEYLYHRRL